MTYDRTLIRVISVEPGNDPTVTVEIVGRTGRELTTVSRLGLPVVSGDRLVGEVTLKATPVRFRNVTRLPEPGPEVRSGVEARSVTITDAWGVKRVIGGFGDVGG